MSTDLKQDILNAVAESKCNTCALSHACDDYDEHHCKENNYRRYEAMTPINIKRAIKKCEKEIAKLEDKDNLSIHGYWSLGYWQGRLSALEDMKDAPLMVFSKMMKEKI